MPEHIFGGVGMRTLHAELQRRSSCQMQAELLGLIVRGLRAPPSWNRA